MAATGPTPAHDPGQATFDCPAFGLQEQTDRKELVPVREHLGGVQSCGISGLSWTLDFDAPAQLLGEPSDQGASIGAIAPQVWEAGKDATQGFKQAFGSVLIGAVSREHFDGQQMALGIDQDVALAPPNFPIALQ